MKSETIKQFTGITVEQAGEMLRDNGWSKPVEDMWFSSAPAFGYFKGNLTGLDTIGVTPFLCGAAAVTNCYTCTEIDPCQAPDGCPELEPWMAYVGKGDRSKIGENQPSIYWSYMGNGWDSYDGHHDGIFSSNNFYAIDVRTAWAQEHFPEHCRIRNYQEPDAFNGLLQEICFERHNTDGRSFSMDEMKEAYELGQANPQPTK